MALILGYESGRLYLHDRHKAKSSSVSSIGGPKAPTSLRRNFSGKPIVVGSLQSPLDHQARDARSKAMDAPRGPSTAVSETRIETLENVAAGLKTQLDELTSMIRREKEQTSRTESRAIENNIRPARAGHH